MKFTSLLNRIKNDKNDIYISKNIINKKPNYKFIQIILLFIIIISYLILNYNITP